MNMRVRAYVHTKMELGRPDLGRCAARRRGRRAPSTIGHPGRVTGLDQRVRPQYSPGRAFILPARSGEPVAFVAAEIEAADDAFLPRER